METFHSAQKLKIAFKRVKKHCHITPVLESSILNEKTGVELFLKSEHLQKTGSFKIRGAVNSIMQLSPEKQELGVCTHSSGNHGQALAKAAQLIGISATIVMPSNAPLVKVQAVKNYGGIVVFCEPNLEARELTLNKVKAKTNAIEIHPYNAPNTIIGQSTCMQELMEQIPQLDYIFCPVGGGGLLSGTLLARKYFAPDVKVIGVEPAGANDAFRSFKSKTYIPQKEPNTIADGLLTSLGSLTWPIIKNQLDDLITVSEQEIIQSFKNIYQYTKQVVEPSGAVSTAGVFRMKESLKEKKVATILCGGNIDLKKLKELV